MIFIHNITQLLEEFAPPALAEEWDNVGLLVGDRERPAERVMTCLTLTEKVAAEAVAERADLIITHHPLPFRPLKTLTTDTPEGRVLWGLAGAGISIYSPHTAFDSAAEGVNAQLADGLNLAEAEPLTPNKHDETFPALGAGRCGAVLAPLTLRDLAHNCCALLGIDYVRVAGDQSADIRRIAVACGSGGAFLDAAIDRGADALVTGEATFHTLLAAEAAGVAVVLTGHYASERFALEWLAQWLGEQLPGVRAWASTTERDPLRLIAQS